MYRPNKVIRDAEYAESFCKASDEQRLIIDQRDKIDLLKENIDDLNEIINKNNKENKRLRDILTKSVVEDEKTGDIYVTFSTSKDNFKRIMEDI